MQDLHGFCDHRAGVYLAIDPHYEGLVEQNFSVLYRKHTHTHTGEFLRYVISYYVIEGIFHMDSSQESKGEKTEIIWTTVQSFLTSF